MGIELSSGGDRNVYILTVHTLVYVLLILVHVCRCMVMVVILISVRVEMNRILNKTLDRSNILFS